MICPQCGGNDGKGYLKYGRCEKCFQSWEGRHNPEPDAVKPRYTVNQSGETVNRRGLFVVSAREKYFNPKKQGFVPQEEAFVYMWFNSAQAIADQVRGKVQELIPSDNLQTSP